MKDIENFISDYKYINKENCLFVLIIDSTYATNGIRALLKDQNIAVIDKSELKKLMNGEDILDELSKTF